MRSARYRGVGRRIERIGMAILRVTSLVALLAALRLPAHATPVDATTLGVIPNDGLDDYAALNSAIQQYPEVYLPGGQYHLSQTIYIPSNHSVTGAGIDLTRIQMLSDTVVFRIDGAQVVTVAKMTLDRPFDNSFEEMIYVYNQAANITLDGIKTTNSHSRAPALSVYNCSKVTVKNCTVIDTQRQILEMSDNDTTLAVQVYGSGITCSLSDEIVVYSNEVLETRDLTTTSLKKNYYQAGAIQISGSTRALVACNHVDRTGNGIDAGGATTVTIQNNIVNNCHEAGIKLVNGSNHQTVSGNTVSRCGIVGIWLSPGSQNLPIHDCVVDANVLAHMGEGIGGGGYWAGSFANTMPAGINLDIASTVARRSYGNTVTNNTFYQMQNAVYNVIVRPGPASALNTVQSNNLALAGEPPVPGSCPAAEPTPFPTPEPTPAPLQAIPGSVQNGKEDADDGLTKLFDKIYTNRLLISQSTATASTRWSFKVDLQKPTSVSSVALYGSATYRTDEAAPGGLLRIETAAAAEGPYQVAGELDVGKSRASNPFTGGKGKRIRLTSPVTARYLRVSGGPWNNSFDNNVIIAEMVINPRVVLHNYSPVHNPSTPLPNAASVPQQAVWNEGSTVGNSRVGLDAVDGDLVTGVNPLLPVTYVLDLWSAAGTGVDGLLVTPRDGAMGLLPKSGLVRASAADDPAAFDTVVLGYDQGTSATGLRLIFPERILKRFLEFSATDTQTGGGAAAVQFGEIGPIEPEMPVEASAVQVGSWNEYP